jgi:carbonic anhydrase/acetyltransferase-like protein (isoleucine patch superfamily)
MGNISNSTSIGQAWTSAKNKIKETLKPMLKYELTESSIINDDGVKLYRIRAITSFNQLVVNYGDYGGYIESEFNLSQTGNAWVANNAQVYNSARVVGDALVEDDAVVSGYALVKDHACVKNNARVHDYSQICDYAKIYDYAIISDCVKVFSRAEIGGRVLVCGNIEIGGDGGTVEYYAVPKVSSKSTKIGDGGDLIQSRHTVQWAI